MEEDIFASQSSINSAKLTRPFRLVDPTFGAPKSLHSIRNFFFCFRKKVGLSNIYERARLCRAALPFKTVMSCTQPVSQSLSFDFFLSCKAKQLKKSFSNNAE
jgi:hypothetical protein